MATPQFKYINKLQDKRVLVFGGSCGIGYAVAEACIEHGCTVILSDSNAPKLGDAVLRLRASYPDLTTSGITIHACDLSDKDGLDANISRLLSVVTREAADKIDHVVFAAGNVRLLRTLSEVTAEEFEKTQVVRAVAPIIIAKHLAKYMAGVPDNSFTITGSFMSCKPPPRFALHAATSVEGLARGLAVDMAPIRVNVVSPGVLKTDALNGWSEQDLANVAQANTTKRIGRLEDIAEAYLYLMKDGFVTGSVVQSNGGVLLVY